MLTLAFAPYGQFYLAWVGLAPWLVVVRQARSVKSAFLWSWLGGTIFFVANMWWLAYVTVPGMAALLVYLGVYWGLAALVVRGAGLLDELPRRWGGVTAGVFLFAAVWAGLEFVRGNLFTGLPWLYLGHTQTPVLAMCQIADALGVYGVSFYVALINGLAAMWVLEGFSLRRVVAAAGWVGVVLLAVLGYGVFRFSQETTRPGPRVLVVQPNYPQDNSGEKSATADEIAVFHLKTTRKALQAEQDAGRRVDLVVWSETMLPALNAEADQALSKTDYGSFLRELQQELGNTARRYQTALVVGGRYQGQWTVRRDQLLSADNRNSAYFYDREGRLSSVRYDKIHLVPFGEFIPFKQSIPWLYHFFFSLSPYDYDYTLTAGEPDALSVFEIPGSCRLVTPICFEDIDSRLTARMFRPVSGGGKRADLLVNLTNDGWFKANENAQHLQAAAFRSIENRVPTARSVNTGISGFVDSLGRYGELAPAGEAGTALATVALDSRLTWYTRHGDVFAGLCVGVTILTAGASIFRRARKGAKKS